MIVRILAGAVTAAVVATALVACSSGQGSGVTTGSVLGGDPAVNGDQAPTSTNDPMARPIHIGWVTARAQRCGFHFDPAKVKASYFAYESAQGATGDQLNRIQRAYDYSHSSISQRVKGDADYCDSKRSVEIKEHLGKVLAGDYSVPPPKQVAQKKGGGMFSDMFETPPSAKPMDTDKIFNPWKR